MVQMKDIHKQYSKMVLTPFLPKSRDLRLCETLMSGPLVAPVATNCGHVFCQNCIDGIQTEQDQRCPVCHGPIASFTPLFLPFWIGPPQRNVSNYHSYYLMFFNRTIKYLSSITFSKLQYYLFHNKYISIALIPYL